MLTPGVLHPLWKPVLDLSWRLHIHRPKNAAQKFMLEINTIFLGGLLGGLLVHRPCPLQLAAYPGVLEGVCGQRWRKTMKTEGRDDEDGDSDSSNLL